MSVSAWLLEAAPMPTRCWPPSYAIRERLFSVATRRFIREGRLIELEQIRGVATSLVAKTVAANAFEVAKTHPTISIVVSDSQAISARRRLLDDHRLLVEPACGAALAPAYDAIAEIKPYRKIVVIVCGGATVTGEQLQRY